MRQRCIQRDRFRLSVWNAAHNIVGSLGMGLLAGPFALKFDLGQSWRLFLATGILGGFTTFSRFSLEAVVLYERGEF